jgi:hypothetical protein
MGFQLARSFSSARRCRAEALRGINPALGVHRSLLSECFSAAS